VFAHFTSQSDGLFQSNLVVFGQNGLLSGPDCVLLIKQSVITDVQVLNKQSSLAQALTASLFSTQGLKDTDSLR